tara:strand:- start:62707 stop:62826 length:120 start_codon:yes stop_codon:yes gene_type:complete
MYSLDTIKVEYIKVDISYKVFAVLDPSIWMSTIKQIIDE